jgi:hypothetical protein
MRRLLLNRCWGQAGLIQAERLTVAPPENPRKRPAPVATRSILRSSPRFAVIPITCINNIEVEIEGGVVVTWEFAGQ